MGGEFLTSALVRPENGAKSHAEDPKKPGLHPVDESNWLSFATFSWMSPLMSRAYKNKGLNESDIPALSPLEECGHNSDQLETLWTREMAFSDNPSLAKVIWLFCRNRVYLSTVIYLLNVILGFMTPALFMRKVLTFAKDSSSSPEEGAVWIGMLIICEISRVLFFTLTWSVSYRTALRVKSACLGLIYKKIFRLGHIDEVTRSKILNVISNDCGLIYDALLRGQVSFGGPLILIMCIAFILSEFGWLPLVGLLIFPLAYLIQFLLAKASGKLKEASLEMKDMRVNFMTQAIHNLKFIKMSAWEEFFVQKATEIRNKEIRHMKSSHIFHSASNILGPTLPHVGAIITFILYMNSGNALTPIQAFCLIALFIGRIRPTLSRTRAGFQAYFDSKIAFSRAKSFPILVLFCMMDESVKHTVALGKVMYSCVISVARLKSVLMLPEIWERKSGIWGSKRASLSQCIVFEDVALKRHHDANATEKNNKGNKSNAPNPTDSNHRSTDRLMENSTRDSYKFQLENLNVSVHMNSFIGVCGAVGSGKSTFAEAIAGSLSPAQGIINVFGKVAYMTQEPWIFSGTLRENIVFGEPFDSVRYYNVLDGCCLTNDFGIMPLGDLTRTDSKGSNLSGGQKQRIAFARAVYCQSNDIFVLDDPFSSLDTRVAQTIFERIIQKELIGKKTVIFITHNLHFLQSCDEILVFGESTIVERGTHEALTRTNDSIYNCLLRSSIDAHVTDNAENIMIDDSQLLDCKATSPTLGHVLRKTETLYPIKRANTVPCGAFKLYISKAGGILALIAVIGSFILCIGSTAFSSWWLKQWFGSSTNQSNINITNNNDNNDTFANFTSLTDNVESEKAEELIRTDSPDFQFNRNVYATMIGVILLTSIVRTVLFSTIRAADGIHRKLLHHIFGNTIKAINKIGFGQLLNHFARDTSEIDCTLPNTVDNFLQHFFICASVFVLVSIVFPVILLPLTGLACVFLWIRNVYRAAIRDLKRIEINAKAPMITKISETIDGLTTLRAFGKQRWIFQSFESVADKAQAASYTFVSAMRWAAFRLECLAICVTACSALLVLIFHGKVSEAAAGLALAYAAQLSGVFQFTVRLASDVEAKFISVERIYNYLRTTPTEEMVAVVDDSKEKKVELSDEELLPTWPHSGHVKFNSVTLSYSSDSYALKDVSFDVARGQKIGIIGRTGSGKSSLGNALFRIHEIQKSGEIIIDGIDISTISLAKLRKNLCVIPQDPSIFQQSIRFNLDPGNEYTDEQLWATLKKVGLDSATDSLDGDISFSQGQKQLLSVARAMLKNPKVIFIDEATSNMDNETSDVIDKVLAEELAESTVFIVAHKISALSYCDTILIMEEGQVLNYGPYSVLSKTPEFIRSFEKFDNVPL